jgi:hypothetical protein
VPIDVSDLPPVDAHPVVYQCDVRQEFVDDPTSRAAISTFLEAHGVNPLALMIGVSLHVRRKPDGTFYLDLWRAVENVDAMQAPLSTQCFRCIKQERVAVPLAVPVPVFADVFITYDDPPPSTVTGPIWPPRQINLDPRSAEILRRLGEADEYDTPEA